MIYALVAAVVLMTLLGAGFTRAYAVFGGKPGPYETSEQYSKGKFWHPEAVWTDTMRGLVREFRYTSDAAPARAFQAPPIVPVEDAPFAITWFGHSSMLLALDGKKILIDPILGERVSPVPFIGPKRFFDVGPSADLLRQVDLVLISHDHYDHLDYPAILAMKNMTARFVVPLGVGAHLRRWGISPERIVEIDWWEPAKIDGITVTATPARHGSGRVSPFASNTLWAGFAIAGAKHRVWYSGDTGWQSQFAEIGERLGPFDLTLIDAGQYDETWPDWHLGPELAVDAHLAVRGKVMLPVHWGLFKLAHHSWTEPAERLLRAAQCQSVKVILPPPGQTVAAPFAPTERWWPDTRWSDASKAPIHATRNGDPKERIAPAACA
ncbi:MBL fold metallo-hydrolase [Kaistia sp. 32K]|uniref:MBL fold metallo-hydrolase n=1 Tax=Kaistia sp. 32K TaxID=2795690 RepID=UPI0019155A2F|nr:MBL fold metallo-hydrolase [Kaistia sp. 32K]BCP53662.1 MBL fold metallo-hydrolase [Kaistia sp. 32K]